MTPLRRKMIDAKRMQLRGLADRTQETYLRHVEKLAEYYGKSPAKVSEAELRRYFLYLQNEKKAAPNTCAQARSALRFLYHQVLAQFIPILDIYQPPREYRLPVVLSRVEVQQVLGCVRKEYYRVCLNTIYACGLRLKEGVELSIGSIDSERMVLLIEQGKGRKDRQVPLPEAILMMLRRYWVKHRHRRWLFPGRGGIAAEGPMNESGVQKAFRAAVKASGLRKKATVHTLRHSYATHLLEAGVNLVQIQRYLGHKRIETTLRYAHLTPVMAVQAVEVLDDMAAGLPC